MICQFERMIYPRDSGSSGSGYMIVLYRLRNAIPDADGNRVQRVKAVGYCLPTTPKIWYEMAGHWSKNAKHGLQFQVANFREVISPTKDGIISYLSSGQIKGVGSKTALKIYEKFGDRTLQILDEEPRQLLSISGISEKKLKKICDSYVAGRGARDIITLLAPHGVSPNRAIRIYREYGEDTMDVIRENPYRLCEMAGIAFRTADKLAMSLGKDPHSPERLDGALLYTLADAEGKGNLCLEKHKFLQECRSMLGSDDITDAELFSRAQTLILKARIVIYEDCIYRPRTAAAERNLAQDIVRHMKFETFYNGSLDDDISSEEIGLCFKLAEKQREAVKMGLTENLCVITGGPGTGKTSVQKVLLDLYHQTYPHGRIVCCAPTGKAARRMEQSTGFPASTVHRALNLLANENGIYSVPDPLEADLVLVDEVSMLDIYLAGLLFRALPGHCRLILVGDSEQLPSVGPGAVLKELIESGCIPVVRLDQVYRQKEGSRIASNAKLIRHGNLCLEYGPDFEFYESADLLHSAELIEQLYMQETRACGADNVVLLSPYRQKTETGVNALNTRIQNRINPMDESKGETYCGKKCFRTGDRVMQIRNCEDISNGDVGYITDIRGTGSEATVYVDFGEDRLAEYESGDLEMLDLAYACTVHKSQGSEFKSVIINLQCAHSIMLVRPLVYTAITRAKEKVIIVGDRKALCTAIRRTDAEQRGTKLAHRIRELQTEKG